MWFYCISTFYLGLVATPYKVAKVMGALLPGNKILGGIPLSSNIFLDFLYMYAL